MSLNKRFTVYSVCFLLLQSFMNVKRVQCVTNWPLLANRHSESNIERTDCDQNSPAKAVDTASSREAIRTIINSKLILINPAV